MSRESSMELRRQRDSLHRRRLSDWYGSTVNDLGLRLNNVGQIQHEPLPMGMEPRYAPVPASSSSSMACSWQNATTKTSSIMLPSLISSKSTITSSVSINTSSATSILAPVQLVGDHTDTLEFPFANPLTIWQCPFIFLGCELSFTDIYQWDTHFQAHFRGHLPRHVECPLESCDWSFIGNSGREAWDQHRTHVLNLHRSGGMAKLRASPPVIGHLWRCRLISDAQEQELRQTRSLGRVAPSIVSNSESRDRRERSRRPNGASYEFFGR